MPYHSVINCTSEGLGDYNFMMYWPTGWYPYFIAIVWFICENYKMQRIPSLSQSTLTSLYIILKCTPIACAEVSFHDLLFLVEDDIYSGRWRVHQLIFWNHMFRIGNLCTSCFLFADIFWVCRNLNKHLKVSFYSINCLCPADRTIVVEIEARGCLVSYGKPIGYLLSSNVRLSLNALILVHLTYHWQDVSASRIDVDIGSPAETLASNIFNVLPCINWLTFHIIAVTYVPRLLQWYQYHVVSVVMCHAKVAMPYW